MRGVTKEQASQAEIQEIRPCSRKLVMSIRAASVKEGRERSVPRLSSVFPNLGGTCESKHCDLQAPDLAGEADPCAQLGSA